MCEAECYGAVELGGTHVRAIVADADRNVFARLEMPTAGPREVFQRLIDFFGHAAGPSGQLACIGIASFGPLDLDLRSSGHGTITTTPKSGWQGFNPKQALESALGLPTAIETDVNAAALAEALWGAGRNTDSLVYVTVGTGIGGGVIADGRIFPGVRHPEVGHIRVPRHSADTFPGSCPFHRDCVEGLAAGPSLLARWGRRLSELPSDHPALAIEAHYLGHLLSTLALVYAPSRIVLGGGVTEAAGLLPLVRRELCTLLNRYIGRPEYDAAVDQFIVPPALGSAAGVTGALALAMRLTAPN